jgi:hypothetical protein
MYNPLSFDVMLDRNLKTDLLKIVVDTVVISYCTISSELVTKSNIFVYNAIIGKGF